MRGVGLYCYKDLCISCFFLELKNKGIAVPSHAETVIGQPSNLPSPPPDPPGMIKIK